MNYMKKIGIITFHASHNYGSMLQAYALRQVVKGLGYECEIINFRTPRQRRIYRPFALEFTRLLSMAKSLLFPKLALDDFKKHRLFEQFLRDYLVVGEEVYSDSFKLKEAHFDYDAYISGSDQIWNTICYDHDSAYFLDFVASGARKIAYAPSMGPHSREEMNAGNDSAIKNYLSTYDSISVRDEVTAERIERITGSKPLICLDPTLLMDKDVWLSMADDKPLVEDGYILLYSPFYDEQLYDKAIGLADKYGLKVVVTIPYSHFRFRNEKRMKFYTAVGPKEFLTLVKFARFVVCKSFHGVIFSLFFSRPFCAYRGMEDDRVSWLLKLAGLEKLAEFPEAIDFAAGEELSSRASSLLKPFKEESIKFLRNALP